MKLGPTLRQTAEFGIGLTAIATLMLTGCGGGGSSSNNSATNNTVSTTSMKVTPGKGVMYGATVTIANNSGATVLSSSTTGVQGATDAGTATISISSAAAGPFVVSVTCPTTCQYFDEKSGTMVNGTANAPAMLAVISSTAMLDIGVTAATNAAAKFALAAGTLTPTSVAVANATVAATFGLGTDPTAILTPPTIISDSATLANALAGTSTADKLASYSAALAEAASGVSALQAIDDYGTAWQNAAITPASGVILPPTLDPAVITTVASAIPVTTTVVSTSTVSTAIASAVADASSLISDSMIAGNADGWWQNQYYANAAAMASGVVTTDVFVDRTTVTSPATNTYNFSDVEQKLVNGSYVTNTDPEVVYHLDSTGWVVGANAGTVVNNLDGTLTVTPTGGTPSAVMITRVDLTGTTVPCYTASCVTATYPAGSVYYFSTPVTPAPHYVVTSGTSQFPAKVTDLNGTTLTALPAGGASICIQHGPGAQVFTPINPAPASGDNYNVFGSWSCSATDITGALTGTPMGTITLSFENTGNTVDPQVGLATVTTSAGLAAFPWLNNAIVAVRAGQVYPGWKRNSPVNLDSWTKAAVNAELTANGYPALQ